MTDIVWHRPDKSSFDGNYIRLEYPKEKLKPDGSYDRETFLKLLLLAIKIKLSDKRRSDKV